MQGISKEMLPRLMDKISDLCDNEDNIDYYIIEKLLIEECTELNPWLPIEQAPKGRKLLIKFVDGYISVNDLEHITGMIATHYQELPPDPKE